jgi:hypothetical protein
VLPSSISYFEISKSSNNKMYLPMHNAFLKEPVGDVHGIKR